MPPVNPRVWSVASHQQVFDVLQAADRAMTVSQIFYRLPKLTITAVSGALRYRRDTRGDIETPRQGVWRIIREHREKG